ncbi:centlein [Gracilinanus agilis]|uniref:centlein n=1 Tax=Gracilinanus agilis TaxID=191870 RepID=UPI001CFE5CDC|nr:centlein [Gracilinanus agilis]
MEREKTKAEAKDRKVLEILHAKDTRIKELEKRESGSQQEINTLVKKKICIDEENVFLKKELNDLQKKFKDQCQELKRVQKKEEQNIMIIRELEEENKELNIRCTELLNDLENLRKQEIQWRKEKNEIDHRMKQLIRYGAIILLNLRNGAAWDCKVALLKPVIAVSLTWKTIVPQEDKNHQKNQIITRCMLEMFQCKCEEEGALLNEGLVEAVELPVHSGGGDTGARKWETEKMAVGARREARTRARDRASMSLKTRTRRSSPWRRRNDLNELSYVGKELQELQNLYQQNSEHTAQQAEMIQQLHVLNMDAQQVLRNQEDAHTAESISYQKVYNELQINFEAKKATESQLRKYIICLKDQLVEKDHDIMHLTEKIDELEKISHFLTYAPFPSYMEQEFQQPSLSSLETLMVSQKSEIEFLQEKLKIGNFKLSENSSSTSIHIGSIISGTRKIREEPPVKRSRSLSPKRCFKDSEDSRKLKAAERKIENLVKTLQLKIQENDELRNAHEKRKERMQMLQTNYRVVKEQLKQLEGNYSKIDRNNQMRRAESQQLQEEDSNTLWNELTYFKREHQKLLMEKCRSSLACILHTAVLHFWNEVVLSGSQGSHHSSNEQIRHTQSLPAILQRTTEEQKCLKTNVEVTETTEEAVFLLRTTSDVDVDDVYDVDDIDDVVDDEDADVEDVDVVDDVDDNNVVDDNVVEDVDNDDVDGVYIDDVSELEKRLKAFEKKSKKLKEENKKLSKENDEMKSSYKQQQDDTEAKEKELTHLQKEKEDLERFKIVLEFKIHEQEVEIQTLQKQAGEISSLREQVTEVNSLREQVVEVNSLREQVVEVNSLKEKVAEINEMRKENENLRKKVQEMEDTNRIQKAHLLQEMQAMQHMNAIQLPTGPLAQGPVQPPTVLQTQLQIPTLSLTQLQEELDKTMPEKSILEVVSTEQCRKCKTTTTKVKFKTAKKKGATGNSQAFLNQSIKVMSNMFENCKDDWEDVSESSDSEDLTSQNLGTIIVETSEKDKREQTEEQAKGKEIILGIKSPTKKDISKKIYRKSSLQKKKISAIRSAYAPSTNKVNKENENNVNFSKSLLLERVGSMQQQINTLQDLKKGTETSIKELREANEKLTLQQELTNQKLQTTKQIIKKLNSELTELRKEKEEVQKKLEAANETKSETEICSKDLQTEIKQLQCKVKNATNETTKQSSNIKTLKCEVKEKEEQIQEMQGKICRMERDLVMKRHLIEHFKHRQKVNLENNDNFTDLLENLEKKVKTLTEECSGKKIANDALKQMLNAATKEKSHYEKMYLKAKDELEKKEHKLTHLLSKMNETKSAMTELEATASQQLHGLAMQSERAFEIVQSKLARATNREEEFIAFVKALVKEIHHNVQEMRLRVKHIQKPEHSKANTATQRVQCLAASILNISPTDVEELLDSENEEESRNSKDYEHDMEWLTYINTILEGEYPFATCLLEAIMEKFNEKKKLFEEYVKSIKTAG